MDPYPPKLMLFVSPGFCELLRRSLTSLMYADNTLIYDTHCLFRDVANCSNMIDCSAECVCRVPADTTTLNNWTLNNNTTFNARKCMSMAISRSSESAVGSLSLDGEVIPCYDSVKHLGVMLSSKLSWSSHIDSLVNKTAPKISLKSGWCIAASAVLGDKSDLPVVSPAYAGVRIASMGELLSA